MRVELPGQRDQLFRAGEHVSRSRQDSLHRAKILSLRRRIKSLEAHSQLPSPELRDESMHCGGDSSWRIGLQEIDGALPDAGLSRHGVHEIFGASHADAVVALGYLLALLKRLQATPLKTSEANSPSRSCSPVLFCQTAKMQREFGLLYTHGLRAFGFAFNDLMLARASKNDDVLWALEEGARSGSLRAVIGEVDGISFTQTRRLSLASALTGTPILLLRPHNDLAASAALSRWRVRALASGSDPFAPEAPHHARWQVELSRCRGGRAGKWCVEWDHETHSFAMAEKLRAGLSEAENPPGQSTQLRQASA